MEQEKNGVHDEQQSSGSAENAGRGRSDQKHPEYNDQLDQEQILRDLGRDGSRLAGLKDMGSLSGRDDYAGGSGDEMSNESTNEETDR